MVQLKMWLTVIAVTAAVLLRAIISLNSYSGQGHAPMFGDFEAQRHWQEITLHLPVNEWYENTTRNDLLYWGLDYPPLTAYHSLILGKVANYLNSSYVELYKSRGIHNEQHKNYMRATVLIADILIYLPAIMIACQVIRKQMLSVINGTLQLHLLHIIVLLYYPGQILIDNGHFQYNNISLGLTALAMSSLLYNKQLLGSVLFVLAINYKQMELYHSLPFFFYLLAKCFHEGDDNLSKKMSYIHRMFKLLQLSAIVAISFILIWLPFLRTFSGLHQVIHRIFPLARGVFEDKVSNIWCIINIFYKIKNNLTNEQMALICLSLTIASVLPSCINLLLNPTKHKFLLSLINCSLAFFLFSFQVHEKSILLVTLPIAIYFPLDPLACLWFLHIATFSMTPLFIKDKLFIAYLSINLLYLLFIKLTNELMMDKRVKEKLPFMDILCIKTICDLSSADQKQCNNIKFKYQKLFINLFYFSILGTLILLFCNIFIKPPEHLPFIYPLLVSAYSCIHFLMIFIYFNIQQLFPNVINIYK